MTTNVTAAVLACARERGAAPFIQFVRDDRLHVLSGDTVAAEIAALMLGCDELGIEHGARVAVLAHNRWEWIQVDLALAGRGLVTISIDPGWSDNMARRVLRHARVSCVVVESAADAARIRRLADELAIVQIDGTPEQGARSLATLVEAGRAALAREPARVDALLATVRADDLATVMFTGGSSGDPKGVLRTHGNALSRGWAWFPWMGDERHPAPTPYDVLLDPLSFCHSAGRWWYQLALVRGATLALPSPGGVTLRDLELLAPTHFATVPRVVLAIQKAILPHVEGLVAALEACGPDEAAALRAELGAAIRAHLGGRARYLVWGGAAMAESLIEFFEPAEITMRAGYGGTEPGIIAVGTVDTPRGSVGRPVGAELRIEEGEILVRGPAVAAGYLDNRDATAGALDDQGWWHTGDAGALDEHGWLRITGRVRAMFNCNEGTNIDPQEIEQLLEADPYVRAAILVGHKRPYLAALIVPDDERLRAQAADPAALLAERVERVNARLEEFEKIRRFRFIEPNAAASVREITNAQKTRIDRDAVERVFALELAELYR